MSRVLTPEAPWYARRNDSGFYTWEGVQYPSVTTILSRLGHHNLYMWHSKMAAQDSALQVDMFERGQIDLDECLRRIKDVGMRMRAPEIYRDFKGNVGSLVHHFLYHRALGAPMLVAPTGEEAEAWLLAEARRMKLLDKQTADSDGVVTEIPGSQGDYEYLAAYCVPYCFSAIKWFDLWNPELDAVGHEAYVLNRTYGYAGTADAMGWINTDRAEELGLVVKPSGWFNSITARSLRLLRRLLGKDRIRLLFDFKTSSGISETFPLQCAAYAKAEVICLCPAGGAPAQEFPMEDFDAVGVLHIGKDSCELHVWTNVDGLFGAFLGLLDCVDALNDPETIKPARVARVAKPKPAPKRTTEQPCTF
jgi:hypothetical protein